MFPNNGLGRLFQMNPKLQWSSASNVRHLWFFSAFIFLDPELKLLEIHINILLEGKATKIKCIQKGSLPSTRTHPGTRYTGTNEGHTPNEKQTD